MSRTTQLYSVAAAAVGGQDLRHQSPEGHFQYISPLPFVTISFAQTLDGSIAPLARTRMDISSELSFKLLHSLRSCHDGVLVGIGTVVSDSPRLNVREPLPSIADFKQPRPVVMDSDLKILDLPASDMRMENPIICTCVEPSDTRWEKALIKIKNLGGTIITCARGNDGRCDLRDCLMKLKSQQGMKSVLVEGGANIIQNVLECKLASQVVMTIKTSFLGGYRSLTGQLPSLLDLHETRIESIDGDVILHGRLEKDEDKVKAVDAKGILSEWENYASSSMSICEKLYQYTPCK